MTTYVCRLFGGRTIGVTYDPVGGTLTILGQSISLASLPSALQAEFQNAVGGAASTIEGSFVKPSFGGGNVGRAVGDILDNQPTWRSAVQGALANFVAQNTAGGLATDPETWTTQ